LQLAKFRAGTTNESTSCETDDAKTPFEKSIFNGLLEALPYPRIARGLHSAWRFSGSLEECVTS
jgi:hypothetical protein